MPKTPIPTATRYANFVTPGDPATCWEWRGAPDNHGYGHIWDGTGRVKAHRMAWILANGAIPPKTHVLHSCDNPPCCNPAHLFLGSHRDNMRDKERKGRGGQRRGEAQGLSKLTEMDVRAIRALHANGAQGTALATNFGVSNGAIYAILRRRSWAWLT